MHTSISKKLLAGLLSVVMVLSLFAAVPASNAQAASVTLSGNSIVSSGITNSYKIANLSSKQYAKVSVSGTATTGTATTSSAKSSVSVKKANGTVVTSTTKIYGTGKTFSLKVKSTNGWGKQFKLTVKVYNRSTNALVKTLTKTVTVWKKTHGITLNQSAASLEVGENTILEATTNPASYVRPVTWTTSDASVATVENGTVTAVAEGTATITAKSGTETATTVITVANKEEEKEPEVVEPEFAISSVTAKQVNVLEVAFAAAVDTADVTLAVTRGQTSVPAASVDWNADKTVATITTAAKMIAGTHTVTATSKSAEKSVTGTVEIEAQKVDKIVINSTVALTGSKTVSGSSISNMEAYAYYDVLDQYGESLRTSTTIEWSSSCGTPAVDKATGKLTFTRSDSKAFTYNEQIFVTGVYTKTGVSVSETLTVGAEQALNSIELKGFVKKGTADLVQSLPAGFKDGEYFLVYSVLDQNGNVMDAASDNISASRVTFISDNIMVVKEINADGTIVTVNGTQYSTAKVTPGIKVADGGEFNVTAIANKTGNKVNLNVVVGEDAVVTSFTMSTPDGIIADGEDIEIPFVALDQNGNEITNFVTLAKQKTFNTLSFSVSESGAYLSLEQNDDGTASLTYYDAPLTWSDNRTTDGIDRSVSLTSVVVGGNSCNIMISISDMARPDAIADVDLDSVIVEAGEIDLTTLDKFSFYDQYGRLMRDETSWNYGGGPNGLDSYGSKWGFDNDFFEAAKAGALSGTEFSGYSYAIKITYNGNGGITSDKGDVSTRLDNDTSYIFSKATVANPIVKLYAASDVATSKSGEGFKFEIVRKKLAGWETTSVSKYQSITVVDIAQVKNIEISDLNKFYLATNNSTEDKLSSGTALSVVSGSGLSGDTKYQQKVKVKGTYNGTSVTIPVDYYTITADYLVADSSAKIVGFNSSVSGSALEEALYSQIGTTGNYARKDLADKLTVKVFELYTSSGSAISTLGAPVNTVSKKVTISDAEPEAAEIYAYDLLARSTQTSISNWSLVTWNLNHPTYYYDELYDSNFTVLDQYGVYYNTVSFKISNIEENPAGYAQNNFKVTNNTTSGIYVTGAELGDTFDLTIEAGDLSKTVKVTVGLDWNAYIDNDGNNYLYVLVNGDADGDGDADLADYLEAQRIAGLQ